MSRVALALLSSLPLTLALAACAPAGDLSSQEGDVHHARAGDFALAYDAASVDLSSGNATINILTNNVTASAPAGQITLYIDSIPTGVTGTITPETVTAGSPALLVLSGVPTALATSGGSTTLTIYGYTNQYDHGADLTVTMNQPLALIFNSWSVDLSNGGASVLYTCNPSLLGTSNMSIELVGCPAGVDCEFGEGTLESGLCNIDNQGEFLLTGWPNGALPPSMSVVSHAYENSKIYTNTLGLTETKRPAADFVLTLSSPSVDLSSGSATVSISTQLYNPRDTPNSILFTLGALPTAVTASFSQNPIQAGDSTTLTLTGIPYGEIGGYFDNLVLTAASPTESRTTLLGLTVQDPPAVTFDPASFSLSGNGRAVQYTCNPSLLGASPYATFNITSCPAGMECTMGYSGIAPCALGDGSISLSGTPTDANPVVVMTAWPYQEPGSAYTLEIPIVP